MNCLLSCYSDCLIIRRYGLNASLQNEGIRRFVYPSFKADYRMIEGYALTGDAGLIVGWLDESWMLASGDAIVNCPIIALSGEDDHRVSLIGLDCWRHLTSSMFELTQFPGCNHDYIHQNNEQLLNFLRNDLMTWNNLI